MVQAFINISGHTNRILTIIKAKYGLKDKSEAVDIMAEKYEDYILEPELKPEYIKKAQKIQKQPAIRIGTVKDLRKRYE